ncbi:MAG: arsenate reductase (thioredoxin) [Firmicutes bacterium]|nr:arsenate reductase (thioredoxin) [Bacillota bacterium]
MVRIMFLCTGNSCRSQMAEGLARHFGGDKVEVYSAGVEAHGLNPRAVEAMAELGIDISGQKSELIDMDLLRFMDYLITLCGDADERCPVTPPEVTRMHWPFPDPAKAQGSEEEIKEAFRSVRDAIAEKIKSFLRELEGQD